MGEHFHDFRFAAVVIPHQGDTLVIAWNHIGEGNELPEARAIRVALRRRLSERSRWLLKPVSPLQ
jgi:hypothetical protein